MRRADRAGIDLSERPRRDAVARAALLVAAPCAGLLIGCSSGGHASPSLTGAPIAACQPCTAYQPSASLQEIMDSVVDPAADALWKAVGTTVDERGVNDRQPRTDAEWHELRRHAMTLVEAANLLSIPGRRAALGNRTVEDAAPLEVAQIQARLDSRHPEFTGFAAALRETALKLVAAADHKDAGAVLELGGTLDEVCEACHKSFWYPDPPAK